MTEEAEVCLMASRSNRRLKKAAGWAILTTLVLMIMGTAIWLNVQFGFNPNQMVGAGRDAATLIDLALMFIAGCGVIAGLVAIVVCALDWVDA